MTSRAHDLRAAALALVGQVERQALDIARYYNNGDGVADSFVNFRTLIDKLDQFHVFVDLVENRLGDFEPEKRAAQARNLTDIRWRILLLEIAATRGFLVRFIANSKPWPLGSKAFVARRQGRLDEITAFHRDIGQKYDLPPPDAALLRELTDLLAAQLGLSRALDDFSAPDFAAGLNSFAPPPPRPAAPKAVAPKAPPPKAAAPTAAGPASAPANGGLKPKRRLNTRQEGDNVYLDVEGASVVNDACKVAGITLDELASQMTLSRSTLVLLLNGSDAIEKKALTQLRTFVSRNGGLL